MACSQRDPGTGADPGRVLETKELAANALPQPPPPPPSPQPRPTSYPAPRELEAAQSMAPGMLGVLGLRLECQVGTFPVACQGPGICTLPDSGPHRLHLDNGAHS